MSYSFKKESWHLKKECNLILFLCTIWHHDCNIFLNTVIYWVICLWTSISSVSNTTSCDCFSNYLNIFSLQIQQWCHVHRLYTDICRGLNPTLNTGFKSTPCTDRPPYHCSSTERVHLRDIFLAYCQCS